MYDLPFCPSEKPLIRHMSLVRNCLKLMDVMDSDQDGGYIQIEFIISMMDSMETCKELWEELRKDAIDTGCEPDDPALQMKSIDPYRYEYKHS